MIRNRPMWFIDRNKLSIFPMKHAQIKCTSNIRHASVNQYAHYWFVYHKYLRQCKNLIRMTVHWCPVFWCDSIYLGYRKLQFLWLMQPTWSCYLTGFNCSKRALRILIIATWLTMHSLSVNIMNSTCFIRFRWKCDFVCRNHLYGSRLILPKSWSLVLVRVYQIIYA